VRYLGTSLVAIVFVGGAAVAVTGGENDYEPPKSLDSIGSMFLDTNRDIELAKGEIEVSGCTSNKHNQNVQGAALLVVLPEKAIGGQALPKLPYTKTAGDAVRAVEPKPAATALKGAH